MGNLGVKKEDESILAVVADALPVKLEDDGPEEKGKKALTPVKPVMSIKKPLIITAIGAQTPPATPLFNAKLHVRNDPKVNYLPVASFVAGPFLSHLSFSAINAGPDPEFPMGMTASARKSHLIQRAAAFVAS